MNRATLTFFLVLISVFFVLNCTDSCYKDEDNYADAGDSSTTSGDDDDDDAVEGCQIGDVHYPLSMTHPDKPCLECAYLDDGVTRGWVPLTDGAWCDDGFYCTGEGVCESGRCRQSGNPCPVEQPYCTESYDGVCTADPLGDDDDTDDACWVCITTAECRESFGENWGCLDGCCANLGDDDTVDDDTMLDDDTFIDDDTMPDDDTAWPDDDTV